MSDQRGTRVENVRLVRLPDGRLVTQDQVEQKQPIQANQSNLQKAPEQLSKKERSDKKAQRAAEKQTKKAEKAKKQKDILEVWQQQKQIKRETERLELEYEVAKKIKKDLKRKLRERNQPYEGEGIDDAFKELLSPEVKSAAKKLKPHLLKVRYVTSDLISSLWMSSKKIGKFSTLLLRRLTKNKKWAATSTVFVIIVVGLAILLNQTRRHGSVSVNEVKGDSTQPKIALNQKPEFSVLSPAGKKIEELGGFAKVSPQGSAAAYAFKDSIGSIPIKVSQQQIPDAFRSNPSELENLAKKYNATKTVQVDATTVYIGKSGKGPQTAIFTKEGLLVFVVADSEVPDVGWVQYVTNLIKI